MIRVSAEGPTGTPATGSPSLGAALVPVPARLGQAYQSWGPVVGDPGTLDIPAPPSQSGEGYENNISTAIQGVGAGGMGLPDSLTPFWRPGIYYQPKPATRFHGALESDNQMPIPAENPLRKGKMMVAMPGPVQLRDRQVAWPITLPYYNARF